jgi:hypothetical protein
MARRAGMNNASALTAISTRNTLLSFVRSEGNNWQPRDAPSIVLDWAVESLQKKG